MAELISVTRSRRPRKRQKTLILSAVGLALAILILLGIAYTLFKANQLMRTEAKPLTDFASNILPNWQHASFLANDQQTQLRGWWFQSPAKPPRGTIVLVHHQTENRLQFDLQTPPLYRFLLEQGFHVLAFDTRHTGSSAGTLHSYGYAERDDVLGALAYAAKRNPNLPIILYGFGSGTVAALTAWQYLPEADLPAEQLSRQQEALGLNRSQVAGFILDTPSSSHTGYIEAELADLPTPFQALFNKTVPYAVRLTVGVGNPENLITTLSRIPVPVAITRTQADPVLPVAKSQALIDERLRLHPELSHFWETASSSHLQGWLDNQTGYQKELETFLNHWYPALAK